MKYVQRDECRVDDSASQMNILKDVGQGLATGGEAIKQLATGGARTRRKVWV